MLKYVLMTPARNEEAFIEKTITSVINQTHLPEKWVIINDGSTDRTEEIAEKYAQAHPFIQLFNITGDQQRNFGSKSKAVAFAFEQLKQIEYDCVGILDADVSFDADYYRNVLARMEENPKLGVAGGVRYDYRNGGFELVNNSRNSVGGPFQLFRRKCYEQTGGHSILPYGGEDAVLETSARMHGWEVRSFPEYSVYHHRTTGTANRSIWTARYRDGIRDYLIGYHPLFEVVRMMGRVTDKPYIIGSILMVAGYFSAMLRRVERPVSPELVAYLQQEQMQRLKNFFRRGRRS